MREEDLGRTLVADAEIKPEDITILLLQSLVRMEPHGIGNPAPLFLLRNLPVRALNVMKEKHLKIYVGSTRNALEAVWWNAAQYQEQLSQADKISLLCRPEINEWKGRVSIQLKIVDAAIG